MTCLFYCCANESEIFIRMWIISLKMNLAKKKKNRIKTYILSRTACRPIFHSTRAPPSWQLKTAYWFTAVCSQVMSTIVPCWDTSVVSSVKLLLWLSYCQTCRSPENVPPASWSLLNGFVVRTWIHDLMAGSVWCSS